MSDYVDKLEYLEETKSLIKGALKAKGVSVSDTDTFRSYADKIQNIQSGGSGGFEEGYQAGKEDGLEEGETIGYNKGYPAGYSDGEAYGKANAPAENLDITITSNGSYSYPKPSDKYYADVEVVVNVPSEKTPTQEKSITITKNGTEVVVPDENYALHKVTVTTNIDTRLPEQTKEVTITENGTTDISPDSGYTLAGVSVTTQIDTRLPEQEKSLEVTENKTYEVVPDSGYALKKVTVTGNVASSGGGSGDDGQLAKITTFSADEWDVGASTKTHFASLMKNIDWTEFNKTNRKNFEGFFKYCDAKTIDISNLDVSNATSFKDMFYYCQSLTSLNVSNWDTSNVSYLNNMFDGCSNLVDVVWGNNWGSKYDCIEIKVSASPLSKATILDLANKISDKTGNNRTQKVTLKSSQRALFTEDELTSLANQFTSKNWTLAWG